MSKGKIIAAVVVLVVVIGVVAGAVLAAGRRAPEVEVATVDQTELSVTVSAAGKAESGLRANVYPPSAGTLAEVWVRDGERVTAGTALAVMDTDPLELQVAQAEAGLKQAQNQLATIDEQAPTAADLAAAKQGATAAWAGHQAALRAKESVGDKAPAQAQLDAAAAGTKTAKAAYDLAVSARDALKASIEASAVPSPLALAALDQAEFAVDQANAAYLSAKATEQSLRAADLTAAIAQAQSAVDQAYAAYLSAKAQQAKLESFDPSEEKAAARAGVRQAQKALETAQATLDDATLVAPIDGVVFFNALGTPDSDGIVPKAATGVGVAPQAAPFTIVDPDGLTFVADVDEADVDRVDIGMATAVRLDALPEGSFETTVAEIAPAATVTSTGGTVFRVKVSLPDADGKILIGMRGDAEIKVSAIAGAVTIPIEALFESGGTSYVYVLKNGTLSKTTIKTGGVTQTVIQVLEGVKPGDVVALAGAVEYADGMSVREKQK